MKLTHPRGGGLGSYAATFSFDERHEAGPGLVHGGLVAAALDEAGGFPCHLVPVPVGDHEVRRPFRRPAHINRELTIRVELVEDRERRLEIRCELLDGAELLADADGSWAQAAGREWRRRLDAAGPGS